MTQLTLSTKDFFQKPAVKGKMEELLGKNSASFTTTVLQIVNQSSMLENADPKTVFNAACIAATMKLPINPNLGFAYIVPYKSSKKVGGEWVESVDAQFQMGYKGFIQLAQRTGKYKTISCAPVKAGQVVSANPLTGYEFDFTVDGGDVVGYVSYFKLTNGFEAYLYMSKDDVTAHALKYSQAYAYDVKNKKSSSNWSKNFEAMALKTVLKLNLSKYGPLSIEDVELTTAIDADGAVIKENGNFDYVDNEDNTINQSDVVLDNWLAAIERATNLDALASTQKDALAECKGFGEDAVLKINQAAIDVKTLIEAEIHANT